MKKFSWLFFTGILMFACELQNNEAVDPASGADGAELGASSNMAYYTVTSSSSDGYMFTFNIVFNKTIIIFK